MTFKEQTPEEVFINPNAEKLVSVFDGVNEYKQQEIYKALRFFRSPISSNLKFLKIRLEEDYGFPTIPSDFPLDVMQALLLNAENINALRGSKQGLQLWIWCLTFGVVTVNDSAFYPVPEIIIPSDLINGYVSKFSPLYPNVPNVNADPDMFLFDDLSQYGTTLLDITIDTKYWNFTSIKDYVQNNLKKYLTFVTANAVINITWNSGVYNNNPFPDQNFVLP